MQHAQRLALALTLAPAPEVELGDDDHEPDHVLERISDQRSEPLGVDRTRQHPYPRRVGVIQQRDVPLRTPALSGAGRGGVPMSGLEGTVLAVCLGPGGIPKRAVASARVRELGLEGDAHRFRFHGGPRRAVCLFSIEDYRALAADGVAAEPPGAYGENLLTEGLDYARLRAGDRLETGDVLFEIDDVREPCRTLKPLDARFPGLMVGRSGFLCRVLRAGTVTAGAAIRVVAGA